MSLYILIVNYFLGITLLMKNKLLLLSAMLGASVVYADSFKLGYVDVSKIFTTAKPAIALQNSLKAEFEPQQSALKTLNDKLVTQQTTIKDFEASVGSPEKLTSADKAKLTKLGTEYQKNQMDFQQKYSIYQQTMQKTQDLASALLLSKVNMILKNISDAGGYDLVLTSNQLVYAKPKYDLTDQVIAQLKSVNADDLVKQLKTAEKEQATNGLQRATTPQK